jgi:hypothetical protein
MLDSNRNVLNSHSQYALPNAVRSRLRETWNYRQKALQIDRFSCRQRALYTTPSCLSGKQIGKLQSQFRKEGKSMPARLTR